MNSVVLLKASTEKSTHTACTSDTCFSVWVYLSETDFTSMNEPSVLSVGLCVMRNLMFLWHSSTGAGRFMVASVTFDTTWSPLISIYLHLFVSHKHSWEMLTWLYTSVHRKVKNSGPSKAVSYAKLTSFTDQNTDRSVIRLFYPTLTKTWHNKTRLVSKCVN